MRHISYEQLLLSYVIVFLVPEVSLATNCSLPTPLHGVVLLDGNPPETCYQMPSDSPVREDFTDNVDQSNQPWHWETEVTSGPGGLAVGVIFRCFGLVLPGILILPPNTTVTFDIHCSESPETGDHTLSIFASDSLPSFQVDTAISEKVLEADVFPSQWTPSDEATVLAMDHMIIDSAVPVPVLPGKWFALLFCTLLGVGTAFATKARRISDGRSEYFRNSCKPLEKM